MPHGIFHSGLLGDTYPLDWLTVDTNGCDDQLVAAWRKQFEREGQTEPVAAQRTTKGQSVVMDGAEQVLAARQLGWTVLAVSWVDGINRHTEWIPQWETNRT